jgi:arylsulfatase A-like enzyme
MLVRWPGKIQPGVSEFPWAFWDFLPTAAELAGAEAPEGIDGMSIVPTLLGREQAPHEYLYWETERAGKLHQAVRNGKWKLIRDAPDGLVQLFDLEADPGETTNVAAAHPDVVGRIEGYLTTARTPPPELEEPGWRQSA